jgi:hypothetical protein
MEPYAAGARSGFQFRGVPIADVTLLQKSGANLLDQFEFDVVDAGPLVERRGFQKDTPAYCVPLDSKSCKRRALPPIARQQHLDIAELDARRRDGHRRN